MGTILLVFGSAIVGAVVGAVLAAYLQKRWTPDPTAEIVLLRGQVAALREQVSSFQKHIGKLEQERAELEHLPLSMTLRQAVPGNYIVEVKNDSEKEILAETITVCKGELDLCDPSKPKATDDWRIPAQRGKSLWFAPQPDPGTKLRSIMPQLGEGELTEIVLVLGCKVLGRPKILRKSISVAVSRSGGQLIQY